MTEVVRNFDMKRKIIVVEATPSQIADIIKLVPSLANKQLIHENPNKIYELLPENMNKDAPKLLDLIKMSDLTEEVEKTDIIVDFDNSMEFYKKAESKNQFKIITDEFSQQRSERLYRGFYLIEKKLHQLLIIDNSFNKNPKDYRKESPDHKVVQYALSEIFEDCLLQPASENFLREWWRKCDKTENDVVIVSKLRKIDELELPLTLAELEFVRRIRNKCMHFRVITVEEYFQAVRIINKYLKIQSQKKLMETAQKMVDESLSSMQKTFENFNSYFLQNIKFFKG